MKKLINFLFKKKTKELEQYPIPEYIIFSVSNFNKWFNNQKDPNIYANPGIFLRLDKLSHYTIEQYVKNCYGINIDKYQWSKEYKSLQTNLYNDIVKKWKLLIRDKAKAQKRKVALNNKIS